jgi:hypothetical protein
MSLDIRFTERKNIVCPECGCIVTTKNVRAVTSGGRSWYPILEKIGYYVPYEQRTRENDHYGKDMVLTPEQAEEVYRLVKEHPELYCQDDIQGLIAVALFNENAVVINADW